MLAVLKFDPQNPPANAGLGYIAHRLGDNTVAAKYLKKSLKRNPKGASVHMNLGAVYEATKDYASAQKYYRNAVELAPKNAEATYRLGRVLQKAGQLELAVKRYRQAIGIDASILNAHCNLALCLFDLGEPEKARSLFGKVLEMDPDHIEAHYNLSRVLVQLGEFERGWQEHEWRAQQFDNRLRKPPFKLWDGSSLESKHILVFGEQGVGDEVQFASCLPDLVKSGAGKISLECETRLAPLFSRSFPGITVKGHDRHIDVDWEVEFSGVDVAIPIASLLRFYRNSEADFPSDEAYLKCDESLKQEWRNRFDSLGSGLKIGISWRGGANDLTRKARTLPSLEWLARLEGELHFINLQYGETEVDLKRLRNKTGIVVHDWDDADPLRDLDGFAAQVAALDLVISVDNTTVHFAGAQGVPVWAMLPKVAEFRWMLERSDTPWYPSMKLFRQQTADNWNQVIDAIKKQLDDFSNSRK